MHTRRVVLSMVVAGAVFAGVASSALGASSVFLCVPSTAGEPVTSGGASGACATGSSPVALPSEQAEQEKLISILPHLNYEPSGIDKQPTIQFSGVNLQVIDGSGSESAINGTGNLILGYDEKPGVQTGSHNLLLGGTGNSYTSYGGLVAGLSDRISEAYASILGGASNTAASYASTISGGYANKTSTYYTTVSGGCSNLAGTGSVSLNALCTNLASYPHAFASIAGGTGNQAATTGATVSGGESNLASGFASSVSGGKENKATGEQASIGGGGGGEASAPLSSVTGGRLGKAPYRASTLLGGLEEVTEAEFGVTP